MKIHHSESTILFIYLFISFYTYQAQGISVWYSKDHKYIWDMRRFTVPNIGTYCMWVILGWKSYINCKRQSDGNEHSEFSELHGRSNNTAKSLNCWKKGCCCCIITHHWVAGLEDLTEQDGTLTLCKRLSERTEDAGVSDIWTVHTLNTHTQTKTCTVVLNYSPLLEVEWKSLSLTSHHSSVKCWNKQIHDENAIILTLNLQYSVVKF